MVLPACRRLLFPFCIRVTKTIGDVCTQAIGGVVQPFMDWVGNKGVDIIWDVSPVSFPVTELSHCGEFQHRAIKHTIGRLLETISGLEKQSQI